jgi:hypothetical protein
VFNPSRGQARNFLFETWRKYRARAPLEGLESVAVDVMLLHCEYHHILDDPDRFLDRDYVPEQGEANPFLHMSLHLAIEEQLAIDQPPGIRAAFERILARRGDRHDALHAILECLGETVWRAQRTRAAPDAEAYLECLRRQA